MVDRQLRRCPWSAVTERITARCPGASDPVRRGPRSTIGAMSPFLLGAIRDTTRSFDAVLWVCVGIVCFLVVAVLALPRSRLAETRLADAARP
jgi:hypothetical protein